MPGSGQVEQVTVRFQADINQYVQGATKVDGLNKQIAAGADAAAEKVFRAAVKMQQEYAKLVKASGMVSMAQSNAAAAMYNTAMAKDNAAYAALRLAAAQEKAANSSNKSSSSMVNMGSALRGAIGQYLSLGIAISQVANVVKEGMDFNKFMEVSTTAFGVMMKSVDQAKAKMKELFDYAVSSPLTFKDVVSASRQLMAYGFSAKELIPTINTLGIVAKATGVQLGDMAYVYGTLRSQGRAYTRDLMQFAMRGIPIYEELAKVIGKPVAELQKMTEEGKISFKEVEQAFANMTTGTGRFAGFFDEYMKTYEGKMSMLTDVYQQSMGKLTKGTFDVIKPMIDDLTVALKQNGDEFERWGKAIGNMSVGIVGGLSATIDVFTMVKDATIAFLKPISDMFKMLGGVNWDAIIIGISAIVAVLNPLIGGFMLLSEAISLAGRMYKQFTEGNKPTKLAYSADIQRGEQFQQRQMLVVTPVVDPVAKDAAIKEIEKMMDLLRKYQDEWRMIQAKNLVTSEKDMYAVANLENELRIRQMNEEFKGQESLKNQALAIQKLIHADAMDKIDKELKAKKEANEIARLQALVGISGQERTATQKLTSGYSSAMGNIPEISVLRKNVQDIDLALSQYNEEQIRGWEMEVEANADYSNYLLLLKGKQFDELEIKDLLRAEEERGLEAQKTLTKAFEDLADKVLNEGVDLFDVATQGNSRAWEGLKSSAGYAYGAGQYGVAISSQAMAATQGTEVGAMMTGGNPIAMMVEAALKFMMSIENVMKVLNPFTTILEGARSILEPLINSALQPLVDILMEVGHVLGEVLSPFINVFAIIVSAIVAVLKVTLLPILQLVGAAFAWLNDYVIVPVGNAFIDMVNGVIDSINSALGFLGVHIGRLDSLLTTVETQLQQESLKNATDALSQTIDYLKNKLSESINSQIASYRDLYEVGAISATEYASKSEELAKQLPDSMASLVSKADEQLVALGDTGAIATRLNSLLALQESLNTGELSDNEKMKLLAAAGFLAANSSSYTTTAKNTAMPSAATHGPGGYAIDTGTSNIESGWDYAASGYADYGVIGGTLGAVADIGQATLGIAEVAAGNIANGAQDAVDGVKKLFKSWGLSFATGTPNVPYDMPANIHKGEGIIPATFMDGIRKGDLLLSGGGGNGGSINVVVNVAGNIRTEKDLATSIATEIYRQRRSGLLTV